MKSSVAFKEIKELVAVTSTGRDYFSHQEAFGHIFQQIAEVKDELEEVEKCLNLCLSQIRVDNEDLIKAKYAGIQYHAELLATEAVKLASVARIARESD
jgi:hypothetical protein